MKFTSMREAKAAFISDNFNFRCLACGEEHQWTGYDSISSEVHDCSSAVHLTTAATDGVALSRAGLVCPPYYAYLPTLSVPMVPFWLQAACPEYRKELETLRSLADKGIKDGLKQYCRDENAYVVPFQKDILALNRRRDDIVALTADPAFLSLELEVATKEIRCDIAAMYRQTMNKWNSVAEMLDFKEFAVRYRQFISRYCRDLFPDRDIYFVSDSFGGQIDNGKSVLRVPHKILQEAFVCCLQLLRKRNYYNFIDAMWRRVGRSYPENIVAFRCWSDGAYAATEQVGGSARIIYTKDYVFWNEEEFDVSHYALSHMQHQVESFMTECN